MIDSGMYHCLGQRDAITTLCILIRQGHFIFNVVRSIIEQLAETNIQGIERDGMIDSEIYHYLGQRDAIAALCALIRRDGLIPGVRCVVEQLAEGNPENPHIEPVLEILDAAEANLIFVVEEDHAIMYTGTKFTEACNVIRGGNLVDVWRNDKWLGEVDFNGKWVFKTAHCNCPDGDYYTDLREARNGTCN